MIYDTDVRWNNRRHSSTTKPKEIPWVLQPYPSNNPDEKGTILYPPPQDIIKPVLNEEEKGPRNASHVYFVSKHLQPFCITSIWQNKPTRQYAFPSAVNFSFKCCSWKLIANNICGAHSFYITISVNRWWTKESCISLKVKLQKWSKSPWSNNSSSRAGTLRTVSRTKDAQRRWLANLTEAQQMMGYAIHF